MWVVWVVSGDVWTPHVERIERTLMARVGGPYASYRHIAPDDPAVDLQPETAGTVPGSWLIDSERGDTRRVWRIEIEQVHLCPGGAPGWRVGAHGVGAGAGRARWRSQQMPHFSSNRP